MNLVQTAMHTLKLSPLKTPVHAAVAIPGSKSYTNRALIMAAMTKGRVEIANPLLSDDTRAMIDCLRTLGIECKETVDTIEVIGDISNVSDSEFALDANLSGTTIRFLLALSTVIPGTKTLFGKESLNKRPIKDLVDGLRQAGGHIEYLEHEGFPPLRVESSHLVPGLIRIPGGVSSQYFSAILMVAPIVGEILIEVIGDQISKSYIDMTIDTMHEFGVEVENEEYRRYTVRGEQSYSRASYTVEADVSSASYFAAIAALSGSTLTLINMNPASKQGDMEFLKILERMGNEITHDANGITVRGKGIQAIDADMENCPDQAQTLAVLAAFADGKTVMRGVRSLRVKETERVAAVEKELAKMGIQTESTHDTLTIHGGNPHAAEVDTYHDHRMAMSFAVAGARLPGMAIKNPDVVRKTFPSFWERLASIGIGIESR